MAGESLSVVVPVYNGEPSLRELVSRLLSVGTASAYQLEIILVDDGSADSSWLAIEKLSRENRNVRGIGLSRNFGQHNALLCGIRAATAEFIVTMDDDLQHKPEDIPLLLAEIHKGAAVVYGSPNNRQHATWRNITARISRYFLAKFTGIDTIRRLSAYRIFRSDVRRAFEEYGGPEVFIDVLLSWGTTKFAAISVEHEPRLAGVSNYTVWTLLRTMLLILTGYSTTPLRITSAIGLCLTLFGFAILTYVLATYFLLKTLPGFAFLASIISVFGGTQLFALGVMGEYVARIYNRSMDRPTYVVGATTPSNESAP